MTPGVGRRRGPMGVMRPVPGYSPLPIANLCAERPVGASTDLDRLAHPKHVSRTRLVASCPGSKLFGLRATLPLTSEERARARLEASVAKCDAQSTKQEAEHPQGTQPIHLKGPREDPNRERGVPRKAWDDSVADGSLAVCPTRSAVDLR